MKRAMTPLFAGMALAFITACAGHGTVEPLPQAVPNASERMVKPGTFNATVLQISEFAVPHSSTDTQLSSDIVLGPDGNLWFGIWGTSASKIGRITTQGRVSEFTTSASQARGLITGSDHNLWFNGGRCSLGEFGTVRCTPGDIGRITPSGIVSLFPIPRCSAVLSLTAGPNGNLWLQFAQFKPFSTDPNLCVHGQASIREMTTAGKTIATFSNANLCCIFTNPSAMAYGPDRNLWIANYDKVVRMTARGIVTSFAIPNGSAFSMLTVPGDESSVWFAENFGIGRIGINGGVRQFSDPSAPFNMAAGPGGIWFTNSFSNSIGRITTNGSIVFFAIPKSISPQGIVAGATITKRMWFTDANFKIGSFVTP